MLDEIPIFQGIPAEGLARLTEIAKERTFPAGAVLLRHGDPSDTMHVILRGHVDVIREHKDLTEPLVLATLGRGEVLGEIGVLDGEPRSATVVAIEDTETLELTADQVAEIILRYPEATKVLLRTVSWRLRNTDELAAEVARRQRERAGGGEPST